MIIKYTLLTLIIFTSHLSAQIEKVTVSWNSFRCTNRCIELLSRQLSSVQGVESITISPGLGQAELKWKANSPFFTTLISSAMRMVGISIREIRLVVHGTLQHSGSQVTLTSTGDNTRFELLNPIIPNGMGALGNFNMGHRALQPELLAQLLEFEKLEKTVTIEGPLFTPERNLQPPRLVVDSVSLNLKIEEF